MTFKKRYKVLKRTHEKVGCVITHVLIFLVYFVELLHVLPATYGDSFSYQKTIHTITGTWILINVLIAYWLFLLTEPGSGNQILSSSIEPGWSFCWSCEHSAPPRSHHCFRCETCVLAKDHHCRMSFNCLGYNTRRYFIQLNFYFWLAALYVNVLHAGFAYDLYHPYTNYDFKTAVVLFLPGLGWLMGYINKGQFCMMLIFSLTVMFFIYISYIFFFHTRTTLKGLTTHEYRYNKGSEYNLGWKKNLENALGTNWKFAWLSPLIPSKLPGDGLSFEKSQPAIGVDKNS